MARVVEQVRCPAVLCQSLPSSMSCSLRNIPKARRTTNDRTLRTKHRAVHNTELTPAATTPPNPPFHWVLLLPCSGLAPPRFGLENAMLPSEWTGPCVRANAAAAGGP